MTTVTATPPMPPLDLGTYGSVGTYVMATLQRLRNTDGTIRAAAAELERRTNEIEHVQAGIEYLNKLRSVADENGEVTYEALRSAGLVREDEPHLWRLMHHFEAEYGFEIAVSGRMPNNKFTPEALDSAIQTLDARINRINSSTELDMIQLQSLMEARSNQLRLVSQAMSSTHETAKGILGNIR